MTDIKNLLKTWTPHELRRAAIRAENEAVRHPNHEKFHLKEAARYRRMAYAREYLWAQYVKGCMSLDE